MKPLPKYLFLLASFLIFLNAQTRVDPYTQIRQPQIQAGGNGTFFCNFSTTPPTCDTTAFVPTTTGTNLYAGANDFSGASLFNVRVAPGAIAGVDGAIAYDTTSKNTHTRSAGADAIVAVFASPPVDGDCIQARVVAGTVQLVDSGRPCSTALAARR